MDGELIVVLAPALPVKIEAAALRATLPAAEATSNHFAALGVEVSYALPYSAVQPPPPPLPPLPPGLQPPKPPWHAAQFLVVSDSNTPLPELANKLRAAPGVLAAYVSPPARVRCTKIGPPAGGDPTASLQDQQGYLEASAKCGLGALETWKIGGGDGAGIQVFDVEYGWNLDHVELTGIEAIGEMHEVDPCLRQHGTAVAGILVAQHDGKGTSGFCSGSKLFVSPLKAGGKGEAAAIDAAIQRANPGDVIVIELAKPGPANGFAVSSSETGDIPIEWWPHLYTAIALATAKGVVVVAAAGNGGESLDAKIYDKGHDFPDTWVNPFRRHPHDSGSIVVGAGIPSGVDACAKTIDTNYGTMLDAQGWGYGVVTTGFGDAVSSDDQNQDYTRAFSGTSAATAMVAGAIVCLQGVRKARGLPPLTPREVRAALRETGSAQTGADGASVDQRIGSLPDLAQLIARYAV